MKLNPIKHIKIEKGMRASELVSRMNDIGFNAAHLARASNILDKAIKDKDCKVFFGLAGAMIPGGMREIIIDMLERGYIDVFVTTGANLTHDLIEAIGFQHYKSCNDLSTIDDSKLNKRGIDRIYNVFMKNKVYPELEKFFSRHFDELCQATSPKEFLWLLGKIAPKRSILKVCYEKKIPVFCPALSDSGIGLMIWGQKIRKKKIALDFFTDIHEIIDISWASKKTCVFYIGGGTPKNFIQQALQFTRPAMYGVQITTDRQEPGGSSGAPLREGISWGKMNKKAEFIDVFCDATIALPLLFSYIIDKN